MTPEEDKKGERWAKVILWTLRICRWIGYVAVFMLMADGAPPWAWGLLLAIILKRTNKLSLTLDERRAKE